ncbi:hypothetical protein BFW01_g11819 [Lasiodiplodia theobromae]|nr:hypothetical protein BFW01_g11819 [Lasiodiplodia theobromae]
MAKTSDSCLPPQAVVLVTGANGFIASHIIDKLLKAGYTVRGTVRSPEKQKWLQDGFDAAYGPGRFELCPVLDITAPNAFDEVVKGVSAVAHVANVDSVSDDPKVIEQTVKGALNAIAACEKEPSVKRFVYTSSLAAVYIPKPNQLLNIDESTYNYAAVTAASEPPTPGQNRHFINHCAAKTRGELAIWDWVREHQPSFGVNSVLPGFVLALYIDVEDCALLHVAALTLPDVESQRIFAMARHTNGQEIVQELRLLFPGHEFPDAPDAECDRSVVPPIDKAEALLKTLGYPGWTTLREAIRRNMVEFA